MVFNLGIETVTKSICILGMIWFVAATLVSTTNSILLKIWYSLISTIGVLYLYPLFPILADTYCIRFPFRKSVSLAGKAILVTGCDSGMGRLYVQELYNKGCRVYANVLFEKSKAELEEYKKGSIKEFADIIPLQFNVTDFDQCTKHAVTVADDLKQFNKSLYSIINNAGISIMGPITGLSTDSFRKVMDVNVFGYINIFKAFGNLLQKPGGRVINVGSITGYFASPFVGPYTCSKASVKCFTETLRFELLNEGQFAVLVEPGGTATPFLDKSAKSLDEMKESGSEKVQNQVEAFSSVIWRHVHATSQDPMNVVNCVLTKALGYAVPDTRYKIGLDCMVF